MFVVKVLKVMGLVGGILLIKELGDWPEEPEAAHAEASKESPKNILLDEDDKRDLKRKTNDLKRKYCTKGGICEPPPPKPFSESIADAWGDTVRAVKKIPALWGGVASDLGDSICRLFKGE
ncbi:uncharacterized protein LOC117591949 [Drosophila guanche]|uniref:uncharacterized protein LOC117591949 n=1 Tax=Drosophila guanche TaxID=7266 RepID=UPI001470B8D9|nr:uncharacterized protein LOC117591949 [Drosophila guanche]